MLELCKALAKSALIDVHNEARGTRTLTVIVKERYSQKTEAQGPAPGRMRMTKVWLECEIVFDMAAVNKPTYHIPPARAISNLACINELAALIHETLFGGETPAENGEEIPIQYPGPNETPVEMHFVRRCGNEPLTVGMLTLTGKVGMMRAC